MLTKYTLKYSCLHWFKLSVGNVIETRLNTFHLNRSELEMQLPALRQGLCQNASYLVSTKALLSLCSTNNITEKALLLMTLKQALTALGWSNSFCFQLHD